VLRPLDSSPMCRGLRPSTFSGTAAGRQRRRRRQTACCSPSRPAHRSNPS